MLEPTDLVIAKTLIRVLGILAVALKPNDPLEGSALLDGIITHVVGNNKAVDERITQLTDEVTKELLAEIKGEAFSILDREPRTGAGSLD